MPYIITQLYKQLNKRAIPYMRRVQQTSSRSSESDSESADLNHLAPDESGKHQRDSVPVAMQPNQNQMQEQLPVARINLQAPRLLTPAQSRPRLIIDKIILQNFKSYADKLQIGPFHENFTSVIGPNGSGKSNLIESMLFIFGYKANWMRLNRLNQLIHNSSTMGNVEKAAVKVQFRKILQAEDGTVTDLPDSAFSIKRTVNKAGVSKYYINQSESTQSQVKDRFQQQGIDLNNNRFLILQGEVEQISQMKQKSGDRDKPGLLQYLEDIIGSNVYIEQIQMSTTEYNAIQETKHEKGELMKLAEIQLKNMNKGKQQAIKFVKKQRQIYQIHNILQQTIISNNKYESKEFEQKLIKAEAEKDRIVSQQKQKLKKQAERFKEIRKNRAQIQTIQKQLSRENDTMAKMSAVDKTINQQISFRSEDLVKYTRKINEHDTELTKIINQSQQVKKAMPENKQKLQNLKQEISKMEDQLQKYDKPELKQMLKTMESQQKKIQYEIKTFQQKQRLTRKNFDVKFKTSENNQIKILDLERKLSEDTQTIEKISRAEIEAIKIKQTLSKELEQLSAHRKQAVGQLQKVSLGIRDHQNQRREMGMFNDMFEKIMQQNIPGVIGRLGDLGTVSREYDEIITTCCYRLDNILVKNMEAANAVLNFLKSSKLGRATCIILDKIEEQRKFMDREWHSLPNSIRLFDVIQPINQEVRLAFYFAISDTIYCQNSQLGVEYSMKDDMNRRRVISKRAGGGGYIIYELNGLMNGCIAKRGGFSVKAKSKARGELVQLAEVKELEKLKETLNQKITKFEERFQAVKRQYQSVQKDLQQFRREKKTIESSLAQAKQQLSELQKKSHKNNKNYDDQKQKHQKELESYSSQIRKMESEKRQILSKIAEIQKQQRSNQTQRITRLRDDYKISKQQYNLLEKDIQKKVAVLQTTIKRVQENKRNKESMKGKIDMLNRQIKKLQKQREDIEVKASETFNKIKTNEQKIEYCKKQEQQMKTMFEQDQKEVKESKLKIEKAKQQVEICKEKISVFNRLTHQAQQELKKDRQTYRQLSATYDFLEDLRTIQFMSVDEVKKSSESKMDTSVILNQSIDSVNTSMTKTFPLESLLESSPFDDLPEQKLDQFLLFTEKMRTMLVTENQNLKKMSGNNLQIISEFRNKFKDYKKKHEQFEAVRNSQMELKRRIQQLKDKRLNIFRSGFSIINTKLKQVYQLLTRGGDAQLELIDSLDPFSDGINFSVRPPKKAWKEINKLSGGQKTLSSLSLIFALHYYKPTPLYFMDEIDAALDFKNVSIVADYIKKRTKDAQFIIISLRNNMFELADKLVGVYKTYDKTKIVHFVPSKMRRAVISAKEKENLDYNKP